MNKSKFTPGPWDVLEQRHVPFIHVEHDGKTVAIPVNNMMRIGTKMTHAEFDLNIEKVKVGNGAFIISSYTRTIFIEKKTLDKFSSLGLSCIKKEKDGTGFYVARGRHFDYVLNSMLHYSDYAIKAAGL